MINDKDIKTVVPALRFPEFRDAERWEIVYLGRVCDVVGGGTPDTKEDSYWNGDILWLTPSEVGDRFISNSIRKITLQGLKNSSAKLLPAGSIVLTSRATLGEMSILKVEASTNQGFQSLVPKKETNGGYIYYLQPIIKEQCLKFSKGSTFLEVSSASVKSFEIPFTSSKEQAKIADCLGSLDDLIGAVADKIEALKEYKKGLMQQLFPSEGKTTPALRFPEFQNTGEWRDTTLREEVYYENVKAHENDINKVGQYIVVNSKFISTDGEVVKYTDNPSCLAEKGDILMVLSDVPNGRAIAKCFIVDSDDKYTVNQRICKLKSKKTIGLLLYYIINRNPFLLAFDDGIKQTNLKKDDVLNCPFRLPKEAKEQQRIADSFSSIDDLISAEVDKLDQLKAHKKGLMQQLFPTINKL